MQMFRDIHAVDPNVKLFLNDYAIMTMEGDNKATVRHTLFMRKPFIGSSSINVSFLQKNNF